ncbi:MFS transporter [Tateyamaria omphalii]|uniref:MFS transporter n=2 Tax=Tateyamaria omphalii TaxID=299262 RepID=A0A1P8N052_9RHOB|nr:MFS transporter [Tateyamaria omphalii]
MALSRGQKAGWGLADMGIVVFVVVKQLLVLAFLTSVLGVPVGIAGMITTGILAFDIITDPLVGYLSDNTQTRWGRRAPWMIIGAVVMTAGTVAMFMSPSVGTSGALWVAAFFVVATIGFTMVVIPYGATAGEMTQDPRERSAMTGWRMAFASIGILIGGALIPGLAQGNGYDGAMMIAAPLMVLPIWASVWFTRKAPRITHRSEVGLLASLRLVLSNPAFATLVVLYGVMTLAVATITAGLPFAALYLVQDTGDTMLSAAAQALSMLSLLFAAFVVGAILSQAIWVLVSGRLGKLFALVLGLALYIALLTTLYTFLPSTSATVMAGMFVLAGMTNGAYQQIPWAMFPDLMDVTRRETGAAIEGAFSAIWIFGQKVANAIAPLFLGLVLSAYGWQETTEGVTDQTDAAVGALRVSITLLPALIMALSIFGLLLIYRPRARALLGADHAL